jgi:glycosyltransferase involved in cell wall biosynthesis
MLATIGIPTFNRAGLLGRAIASALEQDHEALEILVVDNCSTDGTAELVAKFASADPRVRVLRQPRNLGSMVNFETALLEARGDFFMWLADDDWITPGYLRTCLHKLITESHIVVVGREVWHHPQGPIQGPELVVTDGAAHARIINYLRHDHVGSAFYGVARTSDLRSLLPLPRYIGSDMWWMLDLACRGSISVSNNVQLHRSAGGMSTDFTAICDDLDLGWFPRRLPCLAIAVGVTRHLARSDHLSSVGGRPRRLALAVRGAAIVCVRAGVVAEMCSPTRRLLQRLLPPHVYAQARRACYPVRLLSRALRKLAIGPTREALASIRSRITASLRTLLRHHPCP